jgi:hypothetical protein
MANPTTPTPAQTPGQKPAAGQPAQPQAKQAMAAPDAYGVVMQKAYIPAWREKLASVYGIKPATTPEEEKSRLEITAALRQQYAQEQQKQAAAGNPAMNLLRERLGLTGVAAAGEVAFQPAAVKQAAATLSFDPDLAHAVLSLMQQQPAA